MENIAFIDIPQNYIDMIKTISENVILRIFSNFKIQFFPFEKIKQLYEIDNCTNEQNHDNHYQFKG